LGVAVGLGLLVALQARAASSLQLDDRAERLDLWQVAVLEDPAAAWTLQDVVARSDAFQPAGPVEGNLGRRAGAVWLQVPFQCRRRCRPLDAGG